MKQENPSQDKVLQNVTKIPTEHGIDNIRGFINDRPNIEVREGHVDFSLPIRTSPGDVVKSIISVVNALYSEISQYEILQGRVHTTT